MIQYAGAVMDEKERLAVSEVMKKGWFGLGVKGEEFEQTLSQFIGMKGSVLVNSGSSANLLALTSLELPKGSEVITCGLAFPTTVNPIIQCGLIPVFVDCDETLNIDYLKLEEALSPKTKAIMFAHTLGNPANIEYIVAFCRKHNLYLIEDCCDALGSEFNGKMLGSFGDLSTYSFYPAHHITMGEGGAICYRNKLQEKIIRQYRDWGRDCFCRGDEKSHMGACKARFSFKVDGQAYDHKYVISKIGYNLKPTEIEAAIGCEQLKKLPNFIIMRKKNYSLMRGKLDEVYDSFNFMDSYDGAVPSPFSFPLIIKSKKFTRREITEFLESQGIQTRLIFAGNITRQIAYKNIIKRIVGDMPMADNIMFNSFMVGVYPGLSEKDVLFISEKIIEYVKSK